MIPSSGQETCDCCKDVSNLVFGKILEMKEVGVAVFRYLPQAEDENQEDTENNQVFILQNIGDGEVNLEELIVESGKKKVSCPRCLKAMQHVKHLLKELPPVNIRDVTSICDHCYQRQFFNCPCCKTIVDKFMNFRLEETNETKEERERYKSWLIKTQLSLKKSFSNVKGIKLEPYGNMDILPEGTTSEGRIQDSQIPTSKLKGESELEPEGKKYQLSDEILEKPLRVISFLDFPEEYIKPKPKKEKTGILKSRQDVIDENKKPLVSSPKHHSFETVMKSLSEPNVSDFCYAFPHEKNAIKKRQISSSEIIKYTQDMLKEREEDKKKKADLQILLKEERKRLAEEVRRKREEEKEIKNDGEGEKRDKTKEIRKQEEIEFTDELEKEGEERHKSTKRAKSALKRLDGQELEGEKKLKETEKTIVDKEKQLKNVRKEQEDKSEKLDRKDKSRDGVRKEQDDKREKLDKKDKSREGARKEQEYKSEKLDKKDKIREGKQHDIAPPSSLKDQVTKKEKSEQENLTKITTEKKRKENLPDIDAGLKKGGKDKDDKSEKDGNKDKGREKNQQDHGATSALKDHISKEAKAKSEEDKIKKQQERDKALAEKKANDAQKVTKDKDKQLTMEKKIKPPEIKEGKENKEKGEKLEQAVKVQSKKDDTHSELAGLLKEQLAKQKNQELEQEKLKKEQQKERELAEKKLQELQSKKETKSTIKPPTIILTPDELSLNEDDFEDIFEPEEVTDIIKGQKIYKVKKKKTAVEKHLIFESKQVVESKQKTDTEEPYYEPSAKQLKQFSEHKSKRSEAALKEKKSKTVNSEGTKGIIRYTLSDRTFIEKGWTMLPTEKVVRKMNIYRMRPAKPEFDWFEHNKYKRQMNYYDSGEKLAEFDDNGRGRWYYRTGELALDYYDAEETNAGQRFVVYSTRQPDERGRSHPRTILATFDYSGNGIVFDHAGKIRLKYNQTEGVVLDRTIGPVSHWKWHSLNDPPVLQQVMIDTQMPYKDTTILNVGDKNADQKRPDNEEMLAIEFENFLKEKRQKLTQSFKPFQIKMKAMKINENFSLRVLDQASVYLLFRDGATNLKINIGMVLDHKEIVDTDTAEIGEVSNSLDKLPACTDSIAGLQKAVAMAQAAERKRLGHERWLRQPQATASVDALRAGCSRPLRPPIMHTCLTSCEKMTPKGFKPTCCELYYSTQLY